MVCRGGFKTNRDIAELADNTEKILETFVIHATRAFFQSFLFQIRDIERKGILRDIDTDKMFKHFFTSQDKVLK